MIYRHTLILCSILFLCLSRPVPARAAVYLSGRVDLAGAATGAAGATLCLYQPGVDEPITVASALGNGSFVLKAPGPGRYRLAARAAGFLTLVQTLDVPAAGLASLRLRLAKPYPLQVRLTRAGMPLATAQPVETWVWVVAEGLRAWYFPAVLDASADGTVTIPFPARIPLEEFEGVRKVRVEARCPSGCGAVELDQWQAGPLSLPLLPGRSIAGTVEGRERKPAAGARVVAERLLRKDYPLPSPGALATTAGQDGRFTLSGLFTEVYRLHVTLPGGYETVHDYTPLPQDTGLVIGARDLPYQRPGFGIEDNRIPCVPAMERLEPDDAREMPPVTGRVVDSVAGKPIPNADLWLWPANRWSDVVDVARTDADGRFQMKASSPGSFRIGVQTADYFRAQRLQPVTHAGVAVTMALYPLPRMTLLISGADGKPLQEPRIESSIAMHSPQGQYGTENPTDVEAGGKCILRPAAWITASGAGDLSDINICFRSETAGCAQVHLDRWPAAPVTVKLEPGILLHGRLLQADGTPATAGSVQFYAANVSIVPVCRAQVEVDREGRFTIPHLSPGKYQGFSYGNGASIRTELTLPQADPTKELVITLPKAPEMVGPGGIDLNGLAQR